MKTLIRSLTVSLWFMFLTFPLLVIKVDTINKVITWRWMNLAYVGVGFLAIQGLWHAWGHIKTLRRDGTPRDRKAWWILACFPPMWVVWLMTRNTTLKLTLADQLLMVLTSILWLPYLLLVYGDTFGLIMGMITMVIFAFLWLVDYLRSPLNHRLEWHDWLCMVLFPVGAVVYLYQLIFRKVGWRENAVETTHTIKEWLTGNQKAMLPIYLLLLVVSVLYPQSVNFYQTNIMVNFMIWIVLGLGLNIVIGLAGLLDLGFVAFYAVGAYTYALLNHHFGLSFWLVLPLGMMVGAFFGLLLGYPVLRLRGDYLAIVTLGFGEIIRLVLENWGDFTFGPSGISQIDRPPFFFDLSIQQATMYMYYIMLGLLAVTIFVVTRLKNSRIGRAWLALKQDEVACQAMGIDKHKTKLIAFALGASWAGLMGVVFAAKSTFINPMSFSLMESIVILSIVVVGGMGSIPGVITGALVLILVPEWLRGVEEFRMLAFGGLLVLIMVFKPEGFIRAKHKIYTYVKKDKGAAHE